MPVNRSNEASGQARCSLPAWVLPRWQAVVLARMSESASAVVLGYVRGKAVITPRDRLYLDEIGRRFGTQAMRSGGMLFLPMTTRTGRRSRCRGRHAILSQPRTRCSAP